MIPVTRIKAIYIRKGPGVSFDYLGVMPPGGKQVNMDGTVTGESHKGINTWYYLVNTNGVKQYYWGGGVSVITVPTEPAPGAEMPAMPPPVTALPPVVVPQWMNDLQLPEIWKKATGAGVGVAVVDTGIATIADLPYNPNTFFTYAPGVSLADNNGHGTNCAGLIGARNKAGKYIGVAPDCNLYICKIAEQGSFDNPAQDVIRYVNAINWCANQPDIHVISISWGNRITDAAILSALQDAVNNAIKKNKVIVCAIGEPFGWGDSSLRYPACTTGTLGIGAIPVADTLYPFINDHLFAVTTGYGMESYGINPGTTTLYGTSQANAVMAGIVALMIEHAKGVYTPASIRESLLNMLTSTSFTMPVLTDPPSTKTIPLPVINGSLLFQHFTQ